MKNVRKFVLAGVVALITAAAMPAHATISGSEPRPAPPRSLPAGYLMIALSFLGAI